MEDYTVFENKLIASDISYIKGEPLFTHTTIGTGGSADYYLRPKTVIGLLKSVEICSLCGVRCFLLGNGSNLLISDNGFRGAAISTADINEIYIERQFDKEVYIRAFCGAKIHSLMQFSIEHGISGLEFLCGIPGTVGGAVCMNAGCFGKTTGENILSVCAIHDGVLRVYTPKECAFEYRASALQRVGGIVISALFRAKMTDSMSVYKNLSAYRAMRRNMPKGKSMGSVFKNGDIKAGYAIESAGLKGFRIGGAIVSPEHANFILNDSDASSADIYDLIKTIKSVVKEKIGITLTEEIKYIGEFR